jgi:hypothetical protein
MKKCILKLLVVLLLCLAGCAGKEGNGATMQDNPPTSAPTDPSAPTTPADPVGGKAVTLMVYMIGSDLEAKSGAGTNDLDEMVASGVDLNNANVVVYAGGSRKWHNDVVESNEVHAFLELTESGFRSVSTTPQSSMGEADCLSNFLNTAYKNYPAESYALVLWDHGSGPLIGYGLDMLHDNDSLTLKEMSTALQNSPFGADNKLAWIGFDACLMASAELACVLDDYAKLLVASQEIEPNFGWNYSFLKNLGKMDPAPMLADMTQAYLKSCQEYYDRKGFDHRDTTLACMDLEQAGALESAIEALFQKACADVRTNYDVLAASRVNTRALGRATTGSEYDLIDLNDMALQLSGRYSTEAKAIQSVVQNMVIANATNTEGCCGLSLYYPFYNKRYYERSWRDIYKDLNAFPQYAQYLDSYCEIWLGNDKLDQFAASVMPSVKNEEQFVLELTPEQAKTFADAKYYILQPRGKEMYSSIFESGNVTLDGKQLIANFDGHVLYGKDDAGAYIAPALTELDKVGNYTRYRTYVNLSNDTFSDLVEEEHKVQGNYYYIAVDNRTKEIYGSALVPWDQKAPEGAMVGGKLEDTDLSQWSRYYFVLNPVSYITRYENGAIMPVDQWTDSGWLTAYTARVKDGLEMFFAPLLAGDYYLIFEIEDTQGNRYCSELLPFKGDGEKQEEDVVAPEPIETTWSSGDEGLIMEYEGLRIYLTTIENYGETKYALKVDNTNDYAVSVSAYDGSFDNIYCGASCSVDVPAGETAVSQYGFNYGDPAYLGIMDNHRNIWFMLEAETAKGDRTILQNQLITVYLTDQTAIDSPGDSDFTYVVEYTQPIRDALANEQIIYHQDGMKVTLLGIGTDEFGSNLYGAVRYENTSQEDYYIGVDALLLDGVYVNSNYGVRFVPAGLTVYEMIAVYGTTLDDHRINSVATIDMVLIFDDYVSMFENHRSLKTYPIKLSQKGSGSMLSEGEKLVYEGQGIRLTLHQSEGGSYDEWQCVLVNSGTDHIQLSLTDITANGAELSYWDYTEYYGACSAESRAMFKFCVTDDDNTIREVSFRLQAKDILTYEILWVSDEVITLICE